MLEPGYLDAAINASVFRGSTAALAPDVPRTMLAKAAGLYFEPRAF